MGLEAFSELPISELTKRGTCVYFLSTAWLNL